MNPQHQNETVTNNIARTLKNNLGTSENPVHFTDQTNRLNDHAYPILQALVFYTLFPFDKGDVSNRDCHSDVTMTN